MKITINGENAETKNGILITELLSERKVKMPDMVTVELNGNILERKVLPTTALKEDDQVELLYFMGGG